MERLLQKIRLGGYASRELALQSMVLLAARGEIEKAVKLFHDAHDVLGPDDQREFVQECLNVTQALSRGTDKIILG